MSEINKSERIESLFVWTRDYDSRRIGYQLVGFRLQITPETPRYFLGHGYFGYIITCNIGYWKGRSVVVEESSGGVIANSLEDARDFVNRNAKDLPRQIAENSKRLKHGGMESTFWEAYYS